MPASAVPPAGRIQWRALYVLLALATCILCALLLTPAAALAVPIATTSYTSPGVYGFTVPAGGFWL